MRTLNFLVNECLLMHYTPVRLVCDLLTYVKPCCSHTRLLRQGFCSQWPICWRRPEVAVSC